MSRRRGHKGEIAFQLFSFLDVLLCTIGALIIILTIVIHRARANAREEHARQAAPSAEVLKKQQEALEEARWRQEQLEKSRAERQEELQNTRLALSHLEDHIRRLNEKGKELMELLDQVEAGKKSQEKDVNLAKRELAQLKDELAKKQDELEQKKQAAAVAEKWYALIPYDGPNGTRRMPIYIECVEEGVVIQPEGVLLTTDDFRGEPSPGNPLDAALRTKREYIMQATGGKAAEPYPLLVVRPSGVLSYGAARTFMKFWEDEFGYELIAEDKQLDFGPRDPNLDLVMSREIAQARKRQAVLARAMPRKYNREDIPRSFAPQDNPDLQRRRDTAAGGGAGTGGSGIGGGGLVGTSPTRQRGNVAGNPNPPGSGIGPYDSSDESLGGSGPGGSGSGGSNPGGSGKGANNVGEPTAGSPRLRQPNQSATSSGTGSYAGGTPGGTSASGSTSRPGGADSANGAGQGTPPQGSSSAAGGTAGGSGGATGGGMTGGGSSSPPRGPPAGGQSMPSIGVNIGPAGDSSPASSQKTAKGRGGSASSSRGKNWGLPEAQRHVTGVTRPIRVTMQKDKLLLLPEREDQRRPQEIGLSPEMTSRELDTLVAGVQRQMRSWGIAVDGGYWKPALSVDVRPGAEDRFAELQSALSGSGIEVQRKIR
jgi:hypothetical protein